MEVHHSHAHGKKNWKSYFWEFLMLFLAVFCGFMAEYLLEHRIEKEKGRQYIESFYLDLKADTTTFPRFINFYSKRAAVLKNAETCFDTISYDFKQADCLKELVANSENFPDLIYSDGTLQQLKNAGGLRLLDKADADSILTYDNLLKRYQKSETTSFQETQTAIRNTLYSLLNYRSNKNEDPEASFLFSGDRDLMNRYFNQLRKYTEYCQYNIDDIQELKQKAGTLIQYFKIKYHFK
jgi:hypothetical protein